MSVQTIYKILIDAGMTPEGACGLMGNMKAESGMVANIAQRGMTKLTDAEYTALYDTLPAQCYKDSVGYGLCQWTYYKRKENLRNYAAQTGTSVGSEAMQANFAVYELKSEYSALWKYLCNTQDIIEATARICKEFERPAVNNIDSRVSFAKDFYAQLANAYTPIPSKSKANESIMVLQAVMRFNGYIAGTDGIADKAFFDELDEFVADMKSVWL